jgi:phospholipid/cholesterol/gamma-HCH transport system substrate-binding protein
MASATPRTSSAARSRRIRKETPWQSNPFPTAFTVTPCLTVRDAGKVIEFLKQAFNAETAHDLRALPNQGPAGKTISVQLTIPEPTAVAMLDTQRFLFSPAREYPGFAQALWADDLPKLLQVRLIESFENYDIAHAPLHEADVGQTDFQLLIDVRRFRIAVDSTPTAEIGLSARIVDKNGKVVAARLFEESEKFDKVEPPAAVNAFDDAFGRIAKEMIAWTVQAL